MVHVAVVAEEEEETKEAVVVAVAEAEPITKKEVILLHQVAMTRVTFNAITARSMDIMHLNARILERNEAMRII